MAIVLAGFLAKSDSIVYFMLFMLNTYVTQMLKASHAEPRPYMLDRSSVLDTDDRNPSVVAYECSLGYGSPSGHASYSFACYPVVAVLVLHSKINGRETLPIKNKGVRIAITVILWIVCIGEAFLNAYSRYQLGVH